MKYKFITFEGVEGSGKSTQTRLLYNYLAQKNYDAIITREPGGCKAGEKIRSILLDEEIEKLTSKSEILLNFAARVEHIDKTILPALNAGKIVISDRFFDSTIAYQGFGFGSDLKLIEEIQKLAIENFVPDITFLIDVPVDLAFERIKERADNNRYEKLDRAFHERVREGFLQIAKNNPRMKIIDGTQNKEEIAQEIIEQLFL